MIKMKKMETTVAIVLMFAAVGMFFSGCSINKGAAMPSRNVLIIDLLDKPEYQPLLTGLPQTCGMRSGRVYLKPGEECGQHSTKANEEMLTFLSGKGTALIGEEKNALAVGKGKISYIPPNTLHNIVNTGDEPLVYIYCVAPVQSGLDERSEGHDHHH
jgi:mannose-6-phosphate isomerase-like protein (cupin superfamily)